MKSIDFMDIMGDIDETYIAEIEQTKSEQKNFMLWNHRRAISLAASFLLIGTLSFSGYQYFIHTSDDASGVMEMSIDDMSRGIPIELEDEKNIFEEIVESIASFFENLRF
ncbi:MAG: hypothetical protein R3Y40_04960 [Eubacteriales bacterium]